MCKLNELGGLGAFGVKSFATAMAQACEGGLLFVSCSPCFGIAQTPPSVQWRSTPAPRLCTLRMMRRRHNSAPFLCSSFVGRGGVGADVLVLQLPGSRWMQEGKRQLWRGVVASSGNQTPLSAKELERDAAKEALLLAVLLSVCVSAGNRFSVAIDTNWWHFLLLGLWYYLVA